eukprot:jgi/Bigna1/137763/aug1.41_g12471
MILFPDTPLGANGVDRTIVAIPEVPLSLVKSTKNAAGVSVNDVLLAAFSGPLRGIWMLWRNTHRSNEKLDEILFWQWSAGVGNNWSFASIVSLYTPTD